MSSIHCACPCPQFPEVKAMKHAAALYSLYVFTRSVSESEEEPLQAAIRALENVQQIYRAMDAQARGCCPPRGIEGPPRMAHQISLIESEGTKQMVEQITGMLRPYGISDSGQEVDQEEAQQIKSLEREDLVAAAQELLKAEMEKAREIAKEILLVGSESSQRVLDSIPAWKKGDPLSIDNPVVPFMGHWRIVFEEARRREPRLAS